VEYLPINIDLKNKDCLVFGAGAVALRKIQMLLKVQAKITCIASDIHPAITKLQNNDNIKIIHEDIGTYLSSKKLKNIALIISATNDTELAQHIFNLAQSKNILINTVDDKSLCSYISPAIVNRAPLIISVSSSGSAPVLARMIREKIEILLPQNIGQLAQIAQKLRNTVKMKIFPALKRRKFWEIFFNSTLSQQIINTGYPVENNDIIEEFSKKIENEGEVYLVGAGPGDPELLTIKALRVIQQSDVVLHDRLISPQILELVRRDAELINVGKSMGQHIVPQSDTNKLLIKHAKQGKRVCRLKGGDPFIFGRGGEELQALRKAGIKYQIVPGITAAIGCTAYAGIPLTHRDYAQNVQFITAHCKNSIDTLNWQSFAKDNQTLVVYMGLMKSAHLYENLIRHGKNSMTPIAIIENGTCTDQRVISGNLQDLVHLIKVNKIQSPALIVIGEVTKLAQELSWFYPQNQVNLQKELLKTA